MDLTSSLSTAAEANVALFVALLFFLLMVLGRDGCRAAGPFNGTILDLLFPECGLFLPLMVGDLGPRPWFGALAEDGEEAICFYFSAFSADSMANLLRRCQIAKPK